MQFIYKNSSLRDINIERKENEISLSTNKTSFELVRCRLYTDGLAPEIADTICCT
jgi:hypothetical protein